MRPMTFEEAYAIVLKTQVFPHCAEAVDAAQAHAICEAAIEARDKWVALRDSGFSDQEELWLAAHAAEAKLRTLEQGKDESVG